MPATAQAIQTFMPYLILAKTKVKVKDLSFAGHFVTAG